MTKYRPTSIEVLLFVSMIFMVLYNLYKFFGEGKITF